MRGLSDPSNNKQPNLSSKLVPVSAWHRRGGVMDWVGGQTAQPAQGLTPRGQRFGYGAGVTECHLPLPLSTGRAHPAPCSPSPTLSRRCWCSGGATGEEFVLCSCPIPMPMLHLPQGSHSQGRTVVTWAEHRKGWVGGKPRGPSQGSIQLFFPLPT